MQLSPARPRRRTRLAAAGCAALLALALASITQSAAANPAGTHDPIGAVRSVKAVSGDIRFTGWAADPDALTTNVRVGLLLDGRRWLTSALTSVPNDTISAKFGTGPTPGFSLTASVNTDPHTLCAVARDIGQGLDTVLKCVPTPLGRGLSATERAAHSPTGRIMRSGAGNGALHFRGWASDPDDVRRRTTVVLYVDGQSAATVTTHRFPQPRPATASARSRYDISVPVSGGMHIGCVWVVDVGFGSNTFQGCKAHDTRGRAGTGTVTEPRLNKRVVREAKTHIGEPYVWGAEGPHKFDCSGLVMFSYGKFGYDTPRVSEDQAHAARLIPASRVVAGDLAFYHDAEGDVYHVGIYLKPGLTVAAIDTAEGVDYQKIWDPSVTTYGSFTHK
ncbi:MAG TPA: NlpC/P60 family protein [Jatrophihabitans sp.]|jgi:hypothetical protein|nr:NlpC/P60 family protein [Jatrophihabitans sp.]